MSSVLSTHAAMWKDTKLTYKVVAFMHTNGRQSEKGFGQQSIHNWHKKINYPRINLTKARKDLYNNNFKTLKKAIERDRIQIE